MVPPCVGVARKVTGLPAQKGFSDGEMLTLTGRMGLTDTGYWMQDAGLLDVQASEDVSTQDTRSPSAGM